MTSDRCRCDSPRRSLGQVFLRDRKLCSRIARALGAKAEETVVEIGPGRGALTVHLACRDGPLVLIEKDDRLAAALAGKFSGHPLVRVVAGDATAVDLDREVQGGRPVAIAGNLPYNAATAILMNLLRFRRRIRRMVFMFQREVAERLLATPGERDFGALALLVSIQARVSRLFDCPPEAFSPRPRVWSTVLAFEPMALSAGLTAIVDDPAFADFLHALHAQPRKTMANSLASGLGEERSRLEGLIAKAGIDPSVRPCAVSSEQAQALWRLLHAGVS